MGEVVDELAQHLRFLFGPTDGAREMIDSLNVPQHDPSDADQTHMPTARPKRAPSTSRLTIHAKRCALSTPAPSLPHADMGRNGLTTPAVYGILLVITSTAQRPFGGLPYSSVSRLLPKQCVGCCRHVVVWARQDSMCETAAISVATDSGMR
jgi:hypothetical protein